MQPSASGLEEYDFEESIGYWTVMAARVIQKALSDELAPYDITFRQSQVIGWLVLKGPLSQVDLAGRMMIEPATLVGVLDRMERDGYISRQASSTDRRCKMISIEPEANKVWSKIAQCARRVRARASDGMSERQKQSVRKAMKLIIQNLGDDI